MANLRHFWMRLLRGLSLGAYSPTPWVEPSNRVTRAVYSGAALVTMETWAEPDPAPARAGAAGPVEAPVATEPQQEAPKRPGVAA